jgi:large subunit ribosomal protein L2
MGKRLTQQARGKGSFTFRVRKQAYRYRINYPPLGYEGNGKIVKLLNSPAHTAPLIKISIGKENFFSPAAEGLYEGQEIQILNGESKTGNILRLKDIPIGTKIFNIESWPGNGGKYIRGSGCSAIVNNKGDGKVEILINRRKITLNENCRATIGVISGDGRKMKPIVKAGKRHKMMLAIGRKWHRTSAIKVNALDHPFGSGRGKRIKSKIAKRNAPPGRKAGHIRPRRTGRGK